MCIFWYFRKTIQYSSIYSSKPPPPPISRPPTPVCPPTRNVRCSLTVMAPINRSSCWTYAEMLAMLLLSTTTPFTRTSPCRINDPLFRKVRTFSNVDFPAPLKSQKCQLGQLQCLYAITVGNNSADIVLVRLFAVYRPTREYFTHMETLS